MSPGADAIDVHDVGCSARDEALVAEVYHGLYSRAFPQADERELLENIVRYLRLKAAGWYGPNNYHFLIATKGGLPVAASISDYLAGADAGVIEFLVVDESVRGKGIGRRLLEATEAALAHDATSRGDRGLDWIAGEMNDPFRSWAHPDSMDAFARPVVWSRWGYGRLVFPYVQPPLGPGLLPVRNLLLMAKVRRQDWATAIPAGAVQALVREYMRWAMRIREPALEPAYLEMAGHLDGLDTVPVRSLAEYVGETGGVRCREVISPDDPDVAGVMEVYAQSFRNPGTAVAPDVFAASLAFHQPDGAFDYHLWSLRASDGEPVGGMASFFTFGSLGFGGYLTLAPELRGRGRLRSVLARIERRMVEDRRGAVGWWIECEPGEPAAEVFRHVGFGEADLVYAQPPLPGAASQDPDMARPLRLLYKEFGDSHDRPVLTSDRLLAGLADVLRIVYGIDEPERTAWFESIREQLAASHGRDVRWR